MKVYECVDCGELHKEDSIRLSGFCLACVGDDNYCLGSLVAPGLGPIVRKIRAYSADQTHITPPDITPNDIAKIIEVLGISQQEFSEVLLGGFISRETITRYISGSAPKISDKNKVLMGLLLRERLLNVRVKKKNKSVYLVAS